MPIYEYQCPKCGHVFEEWARSSESHKKAECPDCGTPSPRIISRTSFLLKGDGWYVSDYGYRKGISEETGAKAEVPAHAKPTAPAKQGEKAVSKTGDAPKRKESKKAKSADKGAKPAPSGASGASASGGAKGASDK